LISPLNIKKERELVALNCLRVDSPALVEMLKKHLAKYRKANDRAEGLQLHQQQGVCQYLDSFLKQVEDSRDTLEKVRKSGWE